MPNSLRLVEAAMALRAEAPAGWKEFCDAMRDYASESTADMMRCQPELLTRAQGMAIMANELATVVNDAPKLYEKIQAVRMGKKNG